MNFLNRLERRLGGVCIRNLMLVIIVGQFAVYAAELLFPAYNVLSYLYLSRELVLRGQVWRLLTFVFIPPEQSVLLIVIVLYMYYMIGGALENEWGSFKFNVFYLIGVVGIWISALITGSGSNTYLNLSLFFAFAILYPNYEFFLFFLIPVKAKWLAAADGVLFAVSFVLCGSWAERASILFSLLNVILFFGPTFIKYIKQQQSYRKTRENFRRQMREWDDR